MPHNVHLFPFEGTTLHSIPDFLFDYVILFVVESKVEKHKYFGSKQGQYYSKPSGTMCPAGAAHVSQEQRPDDVVLPYQQEHHTSAAAPSRDCLTTGKGSSHMARAASSMDWKEKKNI